MIPLKSIADSYDKLESNPNSTEVKKAYTQFIKELKEQFYKIPIRIEFTDNDPYCNSSHMFRDIDIKKRLKIYTGGEAHPLFTKRENNIFRAVHDYYGHYLGRNSFSQDGEVKAWLRHCKYFSALARKALHTETIGQVAWFFSNGKKYAKQKAGILDYNFGV